MWTRSVFNGRRTIALLLPGNDDLSPHAQRSVTLQHLGVVLVSLLVMATTALPSMAAENRTLDVRVARRDLRPLG